MTTDKVTLTTEELSSAIALCRPNRPVLVTTLERDGTPHVAPFAWCMPSSASPPIMTLALLNTPRKQHSLVNIERTGEFVVNLPNRDIAADLVRSSYRYPTGVKKAGFLNLVFAPAQHVEAPIIQQCRAHVECRLQTSLVTGDHILLVGEVVAASYAAEQYEPGFIQDMEHYPACIHLGHRPYAGGQTHAFVTGNTTAFLSIPFDPRLDESNSAGPMSSPPPVGAAQASAAGEHQPIFKLEATLFGTGFACPDGPAAVGRSLVVADWAVGVVRKLQPDGTVVNFADTGGMPTGVCGGPNGSIYVCDMGRREVLCISPDGAVDVVVRDYEGDTLLGPKDCALDEQGNLFFSDADGFHPLAPTGRVFVRRPDGTVELLTDGFVFPSGLALSAVGQYLYVAETFANRIHRFRLDDAGRVSEQQVFAQFEGGLGPDGLAVDGTDHVYAAHFGKGVVAVLNPAGDMVAELRTGGFLPTNVTFWNDALYVTELERGCVMRFDVDPRHGISAVQEAGVAQSIL